MKLAEKIASKMKTNESSANQMGAMDKKAMGIVENMMKKNFGGSNKLQLEMAGEMAKLAEMDSKVANDFMEYMDDMSSKYESDFEFVAKDKKIEAKNEEEDEEEEEKDDASEEEEEEESDEMKHKKKEAKK